MLCLLAGVLVAGLGGIGIASAASPAASTCDPAYYDTLKSRAWLEAQREITQNQNLISKPDSVLRYSCFDNMVEKFAETFEDSVDVSAAVQMAKDFVDTNYADVHGNMLGGRSDQGSALDGNCDAMAKVWEATQCMNFSNQPDNDAFFTLAEYVTGDDKRFEASCPKSGEWQAQFDNVNEPSGWKADDVKTYLAEFESGDSGGSCADSKKFNTGVRAFRRAEAMGSEFTGAYDVHVCLRQGCVYVPEGETSGKCKLWEAN